MIWRDARTAISHDYCQGLYGLPCPTERVGIHAVQAIILQDFKWIWCDQVIVDIGYRCPDEFVGSGQTGRLVAVQANAGSGSSGKGMAVFGIAGFGSISPCRDVTDAAGSDLGRDQGCHFAGLAPAG